MKINKDTLFKIIDMANNNFVKQSGRVYWDCCGTPEMTLEEKRIVAIAEAVGTVLGLDVDIEKRER